MSEDPQNDDKRAEAYALFDRLMDLPAVEQRQILREECDDPDVRAWVVDLIAADSTDGGLLDSDLMPAVGLEPFTEQRDSPPPAPVDANGADEDSAKPHDPTPVLPGDVGQGESEISITTPGYPAAAGPEPTPRPAPETAISPAISQRAVPAGATLRGRTRRYLFALLMVALVAAAGWFQAWRLDRELEQTRVELTRAEADAAIALHGQAVTLYRQRNYAEARLRFAQAIQLGEQAWGENHVNIGVFRSNHANNLLGLGQLDTAEAEFVTAIEILQESYGADSTQVADARMGYGELLLRERAWSAASREFRRVLDNRSNNEQVERWRKGVAALRLGECLLRLGREAEAAGILSIGIKDLRSGPRARVAGELSRGERLLREARREQS